MGWTCRGVSNRLRWVAFPACLVDCATIEKKKRRSRLFTCFLSPLQSLFYPPTRQGSSLSSRASFFKMSSSSTYLSLPLRLSFDSLDFVSFSSLHSETAFTILRKLSLSHIPGFSPPPSFVCLPFFLFSLRSEDVFPHLPSYQRLLLSLSLYSCVWTYIRLRYSVCTE